MAMEEKLEQEKPPPELHLGGEEKEGKEREREPEKEVVDEKQEQQEQPVSRPRTADKSPTSAATAMSAQSQQQKRISTATASTAHTRDTTAASANSSSAAAKRRDRVSVGSRVSRTVVVRPPYAARDDLDFERRPRSGTTGTLTGSEPGHPKLSGIQPALHALTHPKRHRSPTTTSPTDPASPSEDANEARPQSGDGGISQLSSSSATAVDHSQAPPSAGQTGAEVPTGQPAAKDDNNGDRPSAPIAGPSRPADPSRMPSNDASRWLAFTIPTRYRKRYDEYMAQRTKEQQEQEQVGEEQPHTRRRHHLHHGHRESALDSSSASSDARSSEDEYTDTPDEEDEDDPENAEAARQRRRKHRHRHRLQHSRPKKGRQNTAARGAVSAKAKGRGSGAGGGQYAQTDEEADIGRYLSTHIRQHESRRSSRRNSASSSVNRHTMSARIDNAISVNQTSTPGWNTPWRPGPVNKNRQHSGLQRVQSDVGFEGLGMSQARIQALNDPNSHGHDTTPGKKKKKRTRYQKYQTWLIKSAFAPLLFRLFNLVFSACTLAVAINIREISRRHGVMGIMGSSITFAIVVGPLSIVHIFINVYAEYFGSPIGVWRVRSKMFYTFTELIFVCLWSALLSLSFDDLFNSTAGCTSYTPNAQYQEINLGSASVDGTIADQLCDNQTALISMVFVGIILYLLVLIVSLFRIFAKISRIH